MHVSAHTGRETGREGREGCRFLTLHQLSRTVPNWAVNSRRRVMATLETLLPSDEKPSLEGRGLACFATSPLSLDVDGCGFMNRAGEVQVELMMGKFRQAETCRRKGGTITLETPSSWSWLPDTHRACLREMAGQDHNLYHSPSWIRTVTFVQRTAAW